MIDSDSDSPRPSPLAPRPSPLAPRPSPCPPPARNADVPPPLPPLLISKIITGQQAALLGIRVGDRILAVSATPVDHPNNNNNNNNNNNAPPLQTGDDGPAATGRIIRLFKGNNDLFLGFNHFLPDGQSIVFNGATPTLQCSGTSKQEPRAHKQEPRALRAGAQRTGAQRAGAQRAGAQRRLRTRRRGTSALAAPLLTETSRTSRGTSKRSTTRCCSDGVTIKNYVTVQKVL